MSLDADTTPQATEAASPPAGVPAPPDSAAPEPSGALPRVEMAVFADSEAFAECAAAAERDRRLRRMRMTLHRGGIDAAVEIYRKARTPSLVVVESQDDEERLFGELQRLSEVCLQSTRVIVVGRKNDIGLYRTLLEQGISEYLAMPVDTPTLIQAIGRLCQRDVARPAGKVCAFFAASGGAGSSTLAHNVAWSLANDHDCDAILIDLDLAFGTAGLDFDLPATDGLAEVLRDVERLDEVLLERMVAHRGDRLSILTPSLALAEHFEPRGSALDRLLELCRATAKMTILDLPHHWAPWVRHILIDADEIAVTAAPNLAGLRNFKSIAAQLAAARPNDRAARLLLNQVGLPKRPEIKPAEFAKAAGVEPDLALAFDAPLFGRASNDGRMIGEATARSPAMRAIARFAGRLVEEESEKRDRPAAGLARLFRRRARG
ncbi:CpaE family protein [Jiella sp. M17.18]|uniref:AAA family ATPase n=1 Tax=Jiella sp. M17.18 TaxID=3234247 RepID=UPI0034DF0448